MINRSAVLVRPRQPYIDWLGTLDICDLRTPSSEDATLYLIPWCEDSGDLARVVAQVHEQIFRRELILRSDEEATWPPDRSLEVFKQWFDVEFFYKVEDVAAGPIDTVV